MASNKYIIRVEYTNGDCFAGSYYTVKGFKIARAAYRRNDKVKTITWPLTNGIGF